MTHWMAVRSLWLLCQLNLLEIHLSIYLILIEDMFIDFRERGMRKERQRVRNTDLLLHVQAPTRDWTNNLLMYRKTLQPTKSPSQVRNPPFITCQTPAMQDVMESCSWGGASPKALSYKITGWGHCSKLLTVGGCWPQCYRNKHWRSHTWQGALAWRSPVYPGAKRWRKCKYLGALHWNCLVLGDPLKL